jgi:ABC transport system ATP-binding/permease protein
MTFDPVRAGARPSPGASVPLQIHVAGRSRTLRPGEQLVIGRDEASDLQVLGPRVSREHLLVRSTPEGWQLVDRSRNGSFAGGRPFREMTVTGPVTVRLGDAQAGPELRVATIGAAPPRPPAPPVRPTPPPGGPTRAADP